MNEIVLKGIDGANPLGFLAAVGTLRALSQAGSSGEEPFPRMGWRRKEGGWRPVVTGGSNWDESAILTRVCEGLGKMKDHPSLGFADDLSLPPDSFRYVAARAREAASREDRVFPDYVAAFGCESVIDKNTENIADTAIRTMSGAGHQHFLGTMRTLVEDTEAHHVEKALFSMWRYDDPLEKHAMRWDPADDVRYALQWQNPSGDKLRKTGGGMWGANRLAIEALPLFPTAPRNRSLETTGFSRKRREGVFWTWPIWEPLITVETLRSLLSLGELQRERPNRDWLKKFGVEEVFRAQRLTQGKFRNFSVGVPV